MPKILTDSGLEYYTNKIENNIKYLQSTYEEEGWLIKTFIDGTFCATIEQLQVIQVQPLASSGTLASIYYGDVPYVGTPPSLGQTDLSGMGCNLLQTSGWGFLVKMSSTVNFLSNYRFISFSNISTAQIRVQWWLEG